jgi:hypothetical protein
MHRELSLLNTECQQLIGDEITAGFFDTNQRLDGLHMLCGESTNRVDMYHQELTSALRFQQASVQASTGYQTEKLNGLESILTRLSNSTNDSLTKWDKMERSVRENEERLGKTIDSISDRLQDVSSMSQSQSSTIKQLVGMIQCLQLDVEGIRNEQQQTSHVTRLKDESPNPPTSKENTFDRNVFYKSISRLCNLDTTKDKDLFSTEAQSIIQELAQIMASLVESMMSPAVIDRQGMITGQRRVALDQIGNILRASCRLNIREQGNFQWLRYYITTLDS